MPRSWRHVPCLGATALVGGPGPAHRRSERWCAAALLLRQSAHRGKTMQVRDGMSDVVLTVGPDHTLRDAAKAMGRRGVGAAVVLDPEQPGPGIITERDILLSLAEGRDPDSERVSEHLSEKLTFAAPDWSLE